jgi:hypothetical protein
MSTGRAQSEVVDVPLGSRFEGTDQLELIPIEGAHAGVGFQPDDQILKLELCGVACRV